MDSSAPGSDLPCERASALAGSWLAGALSTDERRLLVAHLAACSDCDADLRARLAARAALASSEPSSEPSTGARARGLLATGVRGFGRFRGALLLACVGAVLLASFDQSRRASRLQSTTGAVHCEGRQIAAGDELSEGAIVSVPREARATFARGALRFEVEGPARVRAARRGFDLLSGAARVVGDGTVGTSRGALTCDEAVVDLVESAAGFELRCASGVARLAAHETHQLAPGAHLRFVRASAVPLR
jgi:hypothetical protein